jgi:predicted dehydrogenase
LLVGCGGMGRTWMKNLTTTPSCELVGVVDLRAEAAQAAAKEFHLPATAAFTNLRAAIRACRPDFVCDITVPDAHCVTTVTALKHGVPVLGEKPLASTLAQARRMGAAAKKSGRLYMVSQSRRYDAKHIALAEAIASGGIGAVTTVNCDFYVGAHFGGFRDAMESPLILDMAIHHFDLMRFFTGLDPVAVYAQEFNPKGSWYAGDVAASVIFEMSGGVIFTYRGSWCAEGLHTSWNGDWRVIGDRGTMVYDHDQAPKGQRVKEGGKAGFHRELEDVPIAVRDLPRTGIAGSLDEFLAALARGATPQCEAHDNIKSLAMVLAAIRSSRSGRRVAVTW